MRQVFLFMLFMIITNTLIIAQDGLPCAGIATVIYEGKTYNTVQVGTQCWLKENLDVGTRINTSTQQTNNNIIEKYCYGNLAAHCSTYGGLYRWDEVMQYVTTEGAKGICPTGWHIPTVAELHVLGAYVNESGNALKEIGQGTGNGIGTNTSGFSLLLSGIYENGGFMGISFIGGTIGSSQSGPDNAYSISVYGDVNTIDYHNGSKYAYTTVRCIKDGGAVGINDDSQNLSSPNSISLKQNYPNPFNPSTNIDFSLPTKSNVKLTIYNALGNEIKVLVNREFESGNHSVKFDASQLSSGNYYYKIETGAFVETKKMQLIK